MSIRANHYANQNKVRKTVPTTIPTMFKKWRNSEEKSQAHNLSPSEKSTRHLLDTFMLFGGNFDLILQIVIRVYSDHLLTRCSKLGNVFNELLAKSLYLLPLFKLGKVVSATGFEPVTH